MSRFADLFAKTIVPDMKKEFNFSSSMSVPRFEKVVLSMGVGKIFGDSAKMDSALDALSYIAGQRACFRKAKKSVASFKTREGMKIGIVVTLRKSRMYEFLDRFRNMALPRMRDFKGFDKRSINGRSFSFGVKDFSAFPEVRELIKSNDILGLNVTFVLSSGDRESVCSLLRKFGFPFVGQED